MHHDHVDLNVAVLRGTVSSEPKVRDLPSGSSVTNVEVTTRLDDSTCSVPVVLHDATVTVATGDEVVVVGHVARRFFRAGGVTQSRTEVVARSIVKASRRRSVERAVGAALEAISRAA
jgi:single-strand DNA-binding protein